MDFEPNENPDAETNPYATPEAQIETATGGAPLAGRGTRLLAAILDGLLYGIAWIPGGFVMFETLANSDDSELGIDYGEVFSAPLGIVSAVIWLAILTVNLVWLSQRGQTIFKRVLGIRIVLVSDESNPGFLRAGLVRYIVFMFVGLVPVGGLINLIDVLLIFNSERRCLHDFLAGTKVVDVV